MRPRVVMAVAVIASCSATLIMPAHAAAAGTECLSVREGKNGLDLISNMGSEAELVLVDKNGKKRGKLQLSNIVLQSNRSFFKVMPTSGALELRTKARFAVIPGFHHSDALFDPTLCKHKELYVAADNFLMLIPEAGRTVGKDTSAPTLTDDLSAEEDLGMDDDLGLDDDLAEDTPRSGTSAFIFIWAKNNKQVPKLVVDGKGKTARFSAMRLSFEGKPIFVTALDHVSYVDYLADKKHKFNLGDQSSHCRYVRISTGFKLPFPAHWWAAVAKAPKKHAVSGVPATMWRLLERDAGWNDYKGPFRKPSSVYRGEWVVNIEERYQPYYAAVTYAKARHKQRTPQKNCTLSDLFMEALGKEQFHKMIDYEGLKCAGWYVPKGEPWVENTCAGRWGPPKMLEKRDKAKFIWSLQALYNFCYYNKKRSDNYRETAGKIIELCKEKQKEPGLETMARHVIHAAGQHEQLLEEITGIFRKSLVKSVTSKLLGWHLVVTEEEAKKAKLDAAFFKRMQDRWLAVWDQYDGSDPKKFWRGNWATPGGLLDGLLETMRELTEELGQEAAFAGVANEEARELALEIRVMVRQALSRHHAKEAVQRPSAKVSSEPRKE